MNVEETIKDRQSKYGDFKQCSNIYNNLRSSDSEEISNLNCVQEMALDMIFVKIARILSGDPNLVDNWHDIAGYARLVEIELTKVDKSA